MAAIAIYVKKYRRVVWNSQKWSEMYQRFDVENPWFPQENIQKMVGFPHLLYISLQEGNQCRLRCNDIYIYSQQIWCGCLELGQTRRGNLLRNIMMNQQMDWNWGKPASCGNADGIGVLYFHTNPMSICRVRVDHWRKIHWCFAASAAIQH